MATRVLHANFRCEKQKEYESSSQLLVNVWGYISCGRFIWLGSFRVSHLDTPNNKNKRNKIKNIYIYILILNSEH